MSMETDGVGIVVAVLHYVVIICIWFWSVSETDRRFYRRFQGFEDFGDSIRIEGGCQIVGHLGHS